VLVEDGRVVGVESKAAPGVEEVDATGLLVLPGAVDAHVHSRDPGFPEKEDFGSLTAAAAAGGVTTVVDMPNTIPAVDSRTVFEEKAETVSALAMVDFALWGAIRSTTAPADLEGLAAAGSVGFKAYLGYAFSLSRKQVIYSPDLDDPALESLATAALAAVLACEAPAMAASTRASSTAALLRSIRRQAKSCGAHKAFRSPCASLAKTQMGSNGGDPPVLRCGTRPPWMRSAV